MQRLFPMGNAFDGRRYGWLHFSVRRLRVGLVIPPGRRILFRQSGIHIFGNLLIVEHNLKISTSNRGKSIQWLFVSFCVPIKSPHDQSVDSRKNMKPSTGTFRDKRGTSVDVGSFIFPHSVLLIGISLKTFNQFAIPLIGFRFRVSGVSTASGRRGGRFDGKRNLGFAESNTRFQVSGVGC